MSTNIERFTALDQGARLARMLVAHGDAQDLDLQVSGDAVTLVIHGARRRRAVSRGIDSTPERIRVRRLWTDYVAVGLGSTRQQIAATRRQVEHTRAHVRSAFGRARSDLTDA